MSEKELMLDPVHECMSRDEMAVLQGKSWCGQCRDVMIMFRFIIIR